MTIRYTTINLLFLTLKLFKYLFCLFYKSDPNYKMIIQIRINYVYYLNFLEYKIIDITYVAFKYLRVFKNM